MPGHPRVFSIVLTALLLLAAQRGTAQNENPRIEWGGNLDLSGATTDPFSFSGTGSADNATFVQEYDRSSSDGRRIERARLEVTVSVDGGGLGWTAILRAKLTAEYKDRQGQLLANFDLDVDFNDLEVNNVQYFGAFAGGASVQGYVPRDEATGIGDEFEVDIESDIEDLMATCPEHADSAEPCLGTSVQSGAVDSEDFEVGIEYDLERDILESEQLQRITLVVTLTASGSYYPEGTTGSTLGAVTIPDDPVFLPGDVLPVSWASAGVDAVRIRFTDNDDGPGSTYTELDAVPAASGLYEWTIPEGTLCYRCGFVVEDAADPALWVASRRFRVKGYELTRVTADSTYERFHPATHGWISGNTPPNMWPAIWWGLQFDYASGIDPVTQDFYPATWGTLAQPQDFPDWPLLIQTYGEPQAYVALPDGSPAYRPSAEAHWFSRKKAWGGSCLGFAVSSLLAFVDRDAFAAAYPVLPGFTNVMDLGGVTSDSRLVINELWAHWRDVDRLAFSNVQTTKTPVQTLAEVKAMLRDESTPPSWLYLANVDGPGNSGAHAVLPYGTAVDPDFPEWEYIYIYDSNVYNSVPPVDTERLIVVDTSTDRWSYSPLSWAGDKKLYVMDPIDRYLTAPVMPELGQSVTEDPGKRSAAGVVQFYTPSESHVRITSSAGAALGYADSLVFGSIEGGQAVIPPTGGFSPPLGYYLPGDAYTVELSAFPAELVRFSAVVDSVIYTYDRGDAAPDQQDHLGFDGGLGVGNPDASAKQVRLQAIAVSATQERVFEVADLAQASGDSVRFGLADAGTLDLVNAGGTTGYRLHVREVGVAGERVFAQEEIALAAGASHRVRSTGSGVGTSLEVLVDGTGDGVYEDTLRVAGTTMGVSAEAETQPGGVALNQNYPNPFRGSTSIGYELATPGPVRLVVYDVLGREAARLVEGVRAAGRHTAVLDAESLPAGVYVVRLEAGGRVRTRTMLHLR